MKIQLTVFTIIIFITSLLVSVNLMIFNTSWYLNQFEKLDVYDQLPKQRVDNQLVNLMAYLKNDQELNNDYYTQKEILHLKDIKKLINILQATTVIAVIILLFLSIHAIKNKIFSKPLFISSTLAMVIYFILGLIMFLKFDDLFLKFHQMAFKNDYWLLNPDVDYLIIIFPPKLFFNLALNTMAVALFVVLTIILLSWFNLEFRKKQK